MAGLDRRVAEIESEWGLDRLPQLIDGELGLRFQKSRAALNDAIADGDISLIAQKASNCLRGWEAVLEAVKAAGKEILTVNQSKENIEGDNFTDTPASEPVEVAN